MSNNNFTVNQLGLPLFDNPIEIEENRFVSDTKRMPLKPLFDIDSAIFKNGTHLEGFEVAGPRKKIFFQPTKTRIAIISCGGLCPGINAVIRALVIQLWYRYHCKEIWGGHYGYHSLASPSNELEKLLPDNLSHIHERGGSILGTSRGTPPTQDIVLTLRAKRIDILFAIGGDGTMRGAHAIANSAKALNYQLAVIGIPKTIDNDIPYVRRSFGFETAVATACQAIQAAQTEASGFKNGIGLVRLMGRHSGYIAASAAVATGHVNFCLIPESPFYLEGQDGLYDLVEKQLRHRLHAVIVAAEGAGQHYFCQSPIERDASGNVKLGNVGEFLKEKLGIYFKSKQMDVSIKYIDPSYIIRSAPANPTDQLFCAKLAQNAVHAAMAGKTDLMIGYWHGMMTHVPLGLINGQRQSIDPQGGLWLNVLEATGQPHPIGKPAD